MENTKHEQQIVERLRKAVEEIRRKPYPISDLIPLLTASADSMDNLILVVDNLEEEKSSNNNPVNHEHDVSELATTVFEQCQNGASVSDIIDILLGAELSRIESHQIVINDTELFNTLVEIQMILSANGCPFVNDDRELMSVVEQINWLCEDKLQEIAKLQKKYEDERTEWCVAHAELIQASRDIATLLEEGALLEAVLLQRSEEINRLQSQLNGRGVAVAWQAQWSNGGKWRDCGFPQPTESLALTLLADSKAMQKRAIPLYAHPPA